MTHTTISWTISNGHHNPHNPLKFTPCELDVLKRITGGATDSRIAFEMGRSRCTVKTYRERIHAKFGTHCPVDLIRAALYWGYVDPNEFIQQLKKIPGAKV